MPQPLTPRESVSILSWQQRTQTVVNLLQQMYEKYYVALAQAAMRPADVEALPNLGRSIQRLEKELLHLEQDRPAKLRDRRVLYSPEEEQAFITAQQNVLMDDDPPDLP